MLKKLTSKKSMIDNETMTELVKQKSFQKKKIQTLDKGTNIVLNELYQSINHQKHQKLKFPKTKQKRLECFIDMLVIEVATSTSWYINIILNKKKGLYFEEFEYQNNWVSRQNLGNQNTLDSFQETYECTVPQKIKLGWPDLNTIKQFCSMLCNQIVLYLQRSQL